MLAKRQNGHALQRYGAIALLFCVCLSYLVERGPYRAIRYYESYDFSTVYAAARCWMHGENPYDPQDLKRELREGGATPRLEYQQDLNPSVYLLSAMPLVAAVAWLRWPSANVVWCLLSLACFTVSLIFILRRTKLSTRHRWIFGSLALAFSPTYVGLLRGNPSVLSISFVTLALCLSVGSQASAGAWISGMLLGAALCMKPQIALGAIGVLMLWRYWRILLVAFGVFSTMFVVGLLRESFFGANWQWAQSLGKNMVRAYAAGGATDPGPQGSSAFQFLNAQTVAAFLLGDSLARNVLVWTFAAILIALYLGLRNKAAMPSPWRDITFSSVITIIVVYHRYYDAQLLLLFIPLLVELWSAEQRRTATFLALCLLSLAFPDQTVFARWMGLEVTNLLRFILMRHQPVSVLAMGVAVLLSWREMARTSRHVPPVVT